MKIKKRIAQEMYIGINRDFFDGYLPDLIVHTEKMPKGLKHHLAVVLYNEQELDLFVNMRLASNIDSLFDTITHEAIHICQWINGELDLLHGKTFYKEARRIYKEHGYILDFRFRSAENGFLGSDIKHLHGWVD